MEGVGGWSWPLHGIRLRTADLDLTVMTEADLPTVWALLPDDLELNPHATTYAGLDVPANRRAVVAQGYWRALGMWSPDDWALPFVVRSAGVVVGAQWLEGPDWRSDRTVDSSSWLVARARGRGLGRQMRAAVLALAFGPLGAEAAISSAVVDNAASLGVSRSLGYRDTHRSVLEHSGQTLQHVRLDRATWDASGWSRHVVVEGVDAALPLFGLDP
ncbi:GNAT family N-acetyltransferase [Terracoccus sp. 273MFTsu3.1]|uniref:GNAT family N-acetyltransferase n=1 Tax=Terracoccus sp. 273MFTsu3.1 TaxID=1172188 RepID=UPI00036E411F|nr:GNAT family N-acetyltransferase [Terracoccus sp. 273MFTsu3.1]